MKGDGFPRAQRTRGTKGGDGLADLIGAGHENEDVATLRFAGLGKGFAGADGLVPDGFGLAIAEEAGRLVADVDGEGAPLGLEGLAGIKEVGEGSGCERRGHDDDLQVGAALHLDGAGPGEGEVAIEVALVELIDDDAASALEVGILKELAEEDALGDEADAGAAGGVVFETDLIADLVAEADFSFLRDAACQHAGGDAARLEDDDVIAIREETGIEDELRDLGGFAGAGGGFEEKIGRAGIAKAIDDGVADLVDGERHGDE